MNKQDLISDIAETLDMKKSAVEAVIDTLGAVVAGALRDGDDVTLPGIGKLTVKTRAARSGRNPATGAAMDIPEKRVPHFSAAKALKGVLA